MLMIQGGISIPYNKKSPENSGGFNL